MADADAVVTRPAILDDADAIATIGAAGWQAAYRGMFSGSFLQALGGREALSERAAAARRRIAEPPSLSFTFVGEIDGRVRGWIHVRPTEADDLPGMWEIRAIYIHPDAWSRGVGRALMAVAIARLLADGHHEACLWTLAGNERAQRFYERLGWRPDGARRERDFGEPAVEIRYRKRLAGEDRAPT